MNSCTFAGRIGTVQDIHRTDGGKAVFNFSLAVDRGKDSDGDKRDPLWIKVPLWGDYAETMHEYIKKGDPIAATGQIDLRTYEVDGEERTELTLNFARVTLLGSKKESKTEAPAKSKRTVKDEDVGF